MTTATHRKTVAPAYFKALTDEAPGTFEAIVAVFNNVDLGGDRIIPGAFNRTLAEWKTSGDPIPVIFSHQWDNLNAHVGTVNANDARELAPGDPLLPPELKALGGLYVKGAMELDAPGEAGAFASNLWGKMTKRAIKEFSFAYDVPPTGARRAADAFELTDIDLIEVGPTLKGLNPATALLDTKTASSLVEGMTPRKALDTLDALLPPPPPAKANRAPSAPDADGAKALPGGTPAGSLEETLDGVRSAASVWAMLKYGPDLYYLHLEATYPEGAGGKAIVIAERWEDPFGEGPVWDLAYTNSAGVTQVTDATELELEVSWAPKSTAKARHLAKLGAAKDALETRAGATVTDSTKAKAEDRSGGKAEEPEGTATTALGNNPLAIMLELEELEL